MGLLEKKVIPNVSELVEIVLKEHLPKRVHCLELFIDQEVKEKICNVFDLDKNINCDDRFFNLQKEINIHAFLGYDAFHVEVLDEVFPTQQLQAEDTTVLASQKRKMRNWVNEHKGPIQSWKDFSNYPWPSVSELDFSRLEWLEKNIPENMGCFTLTAHILEIASNLFGYETLAYNLVDQPELVEAVFSKVGHFYAELTQNLCSFSCVPFLWGSDDMGFRTGTLISPDSLRKYVLPWHKRCAQIAHQHDKAYLLHSCGNLECIMEDLIEDVEIDAKHSFENAIQPVTEAKKIYGNRITLIGGIDVDFLCRADEDEIRCHVRRTLEICMEGGGYCLGTGNSVANYIPLKNFLIMLDEGRNFAL